MLITPVLVHDGKPIVLRRRCNKSLDQTDRGVAKRILILWLSLKRALAPRESQRGALSAPLLPVIVRFPNPARTFSRIIIKKYGAK